MDELLKRIEGLEQRANEIVESLDKNPNDADTKALTDELATIKSTVESLEAEKKERERDDHIKSLTGEVSTLSEALKKLKTPSGIFGKKAANDADQPVYGSGSRHSFYADIKAAKIGDSDARERIAKAAGFADAKAMTEGTASAGGYLVQDQISDEVIRLRLQRATLRPLFSSLTVTSDTLRIPSITGGLTAGWVAELATKPSADMTFGEISASVFTAAGLAVTSNQLLADARPSIDGLINQELGYRLADLEEKAFIDGTGTGQPLGILGTSGVNTVTLTSTAVLDLLDAIFDAIVAVQSNFFGEPNGILMHTRTWARIAKAREASTSSSYIIGAGANDSARRASDGVPVRSLFGVPVYVTSNVPTNKGAGTNESRVIVGDFSQALVLDREGISYDTSEHFYFTTNQTVFRAEERVGFTAGRYPKAFTVISGAGLANG